MPSKHNAGVITPTGSTTRRTGSVMVLNDLASQELASVTVR
jgi:hypothetical protein